jgi:predicted Fe-Mo cluster-binding NifX family protein
LKAQILKQAVHIDNARPKGDWLILSAQIPCRGQEAGQSDEGKDVMKIAIASQNRRTITEHAGRCRKFWIYAVEDNQITRKTLLELPKEQSFHDSSPHDPHPLDDAQVLIAGGMGHGLFRRLERKGITGIVTLETDPEKAVIVYLAGTLAVGSPHAHTNSSHYD